MHSHLSREMRIHRIDDLLQSQDFVPVETLLLDLRCSLPTLKRDLRVMRESLNYPVTYSRARHGYYYQKNVGQGQTSVRVKKHKMPTAWYSPQEMYVFAHVMGLFETISQSENPDGLLAKEMQAISARLTSLLDPKYLDPKGWKKKIKLQSTFVRLHEEPWFEEVGTAINNGFRLRIRYTKPDGQSQERIVSPYRLFFYENSWYLHAWCHKKNDFRCFKLSRMDWVEVLDARVMRKADREIRDHFDSTIGIYSGKQRLVARILVTGAAVETVQNEIWHELQHIESQEDGSVILQVPYAEDTELVGMILKLGANAKVLAPASLKVAVRQTAQKIVEQNH